MRGRAAAVRAGLPGALKSKMAKKDEDIALLLGTVVGLEAFCVAIAQSLPEQFGALVAANLQVVRAKLQPTIGTKPSAHDQASALVLDTLLRALTRQDGPRSPAGLH